MNIFTRKGRALLLLTAAVMAGGVWLSGCGGDDNPSGGGLGSGEYVTLGGKMWMKKNLNVATADSWCYDDDNSNCNTYGRLYTWESAKAACQSVGMRLPTRVEWDALVSAVEGSSVAGKALKSRSGWNQDGIGTDTYGFSALPGGHRYSDGDFYYAGVYGFWWTATEYSGGIAYSRYMYHYNDYVDEYSSGKGYAFSVRCVQD